MSKQVVLGIIGVFLVLGNAALVLSSPEKKLGPAPQEDPLARSSSLPSGNFVVVDGDQVVVCYTSTAKSIVDFCEETVLTKHAIPHEGH